MSEPTDTAASPEGDELSLLVREWASIEDGEPKAYRFLVKAGASRSECQKVADPIIIGAETDVSRLTRMVRNAVQTGLTMGKPKVFVEVYQSSGSKHPIKVLPIDGDPNAATELEAADEVSPNGHALAALANGYTRTLDRLMRSNEALMAQLIGVAGQQIELFGEASALTTEIRVRSEYGYQEGWQKIVEQSMPQLLQAAPALLGIFMAHSAGEKGSTEAQTPDGRFRQRCVDIERAALLMVAWANEPATVERMKVDPNLRMEVRGRLGQLVNAAVQAFGKIINDGEPPPPHATDSGGAPA